MDSCPGGTLHTSYGTKSQDSRCQENSSGRLTNPGEIFFVKGFEPLMSKFARSSLVIGKSNIENRALTSFGYLSIINTPAKLIWDQDSCQLHISGFSTTIEVDPTKKWNDDIYAMYQLMKRPKIGWEDIARWEWWDKRRPSTEWHQLREDSTLLIEMRVSSPLLLRCEYLLRWRLHLTYEVASRFPSLL